MNKKWLGIAACFVAIAICIGAFSFANVAKADDEFVAAHTMEFVDNTNGLWYANSISDYRVEDEALAFNISANDPYLFGESGQFNVDITNNKIIKIAIQNNSNGTEAEIFFGTDTDPGFGAGKSKRFAISSGDNGFQEYTVDMSDVPGWTGTLTNFRLDPTDGDSGSMRVDYIRIGSNGGAGQQPTLAPSADEPTPTPSAEEPTPTPSADEPTPTPDAGTPTPDEGAPTPDSGDDKPVDQFGDRDFTWPIVFMSASILLCGACIVVGMKKKEQR